MSNPQESLDLAKRYLRGVETRDRDAIAGTLADGVQLVFAMADGGREGPLGIFDGKVEVLEYTYNLFNKFSTLTWPNPDWTVSHDGSRVILEAKGEAVVAHSGAPYRNTYVVRFDIVDGRIARITEYANGDMYMALGIPPIDVEIRAVHRVRHPSAA